MSRCVRLSALLLAMLAGAVSVHAQDSSPDPKPPLPKLDLQDGDCIVFLGDSITHQLLYTQYVEDYFYTRFPKMRLKFHNAGVSGAQAWDALQRFDRDVAAYKPKYVTILLGMNDGHYIPFDQKTFDTYRQDMTEVLKRITDAGATPIPMTPTMFDARVAKKRGGELSQYNSTLAYYGTWLRDNAMENGSGFVDMWSPMNNITLEQRKTDPKFTLIGDAVHPGPDGQVVMATAIINDLDLPRQVSRIRIRVDHDGKFTAPHPRGGELTDLVASPTKVEFTWTAESLPWVLPENTKKGVELTRLGHRWSSESIEIHGLEPGRYTLAIDGQDVGTYSSDQLERHVELQANEKTPQYQQALAVAMINKKRNEGPLNHIRGAWGQFQGYAREKRNAETHPDNEELKKKVADLEKAVSDIDERVAKLNTEANALVDEIYKANQPQPHKYSLRPAAAAAGDQN